jgi:hypothetical protein
MKYPQILCILQQRNYNPGDPAPEGYVDWFEWVEVQTRAALKPTWCPDDRLWKFPQERDCRNTPDHRHSLE